MPDQANCYPKATALIVEFAQSLAPRAEILFTNGRLKVANEATHFVVQFTREDLEDLEPVLDGDLPTKYSDGMKGAVRLKVYLAFFQEGLIPNVKLSNVMLEDKRDWTNATLIGTHFDDNTAARLYRGLQTLQSYLDETIRKHGEIPGVRKDLDLIRNLTAWYQNNNHLHLGMIDREVLSLLKGAAVLAIRELEDKKGTSSAKRVTNIYDADILSIVREFTSRPYDRVKLPAVLYDYLADGMPTARTSGSRARAEAMAEASASSTSTSASRGGWLAHRAAKPEGCRDCQSSVPSPSNTPQRRLVPPTSMPRLTDTPISAPTDGGSRGSPASRRASAGAKSPPA